MPRVHPSRWRFLAFAALCCLAASGAAVFAQEGADFEELVTRTVRKILEGEVDKKKRAPAGDKTLETVRDTVTKVTEALSDKAGSTTRAQDGAAPTPVPAVSADALAGPTRRQARLVYPEGPEGKVVLHIRLKHLQTERQMIDAKTAFTLRRAMSRANDGDVAAVILDLDTPGGELGAAYEARDALMDMKPVTNCYVRRAVSAGALLMLACDNIFVAPASWLGDAQPIMIAPGGPTTGGDEAVADKMVTAARTEFEATARANGHRIDLARAFVDRSESIPGVVEADRILALEGQRAVEEGLAVAQVLTPAGVLEQLNIPNAPIEEFRLAPREQFAFFAKSWAWLFLSLGIAGLYFEMKSPGFGVPGILGLFSLGIFFWSNHLAMTASWFEIALFGVGIGLLALEVFVIPGFGVAGVAGIVCLVLSVFLSMFKLPDMAGGVTMQVVLDVVGPPLFNLAIALTVFLGIGLLVIRYLPDTPFWKRVALVDNMTVETGYVGVPCREQWVGKTGEARTVLRPGGTVVVDGERLDAVTRGEFLEKGAPVKVIGVDGSQIVVESHKPPETPSMNIMDT